MTDKKRYKEFEYSWYLKSQYIDHIYVKEPEAKVDKWKEQIAAVRWGLHLTKRDAMLVILENGLKATLEQVDNGPPEPGTKRYYAWKSDKHSFMQNQRERKLAKLHKLKERHIDEFDGDFETLALHLGYEQWMIDRALYGEPASPPTQSSRDRAFLREYLTDAGGPAKTSDIRAEAERRGVVTSNADWKRLSETARRLQYHKVGGHSEWGL